MSDDINLKECCQTVVITAIDLSYSESIYDYRGRPLGSRTASENVINDVKNSLFNSFENGLLLHGYTVLDRSMINDILSEQGISQSGLSVDNQIKIGKLLNAKALVTASIDMASKRTMFEKKSVYSSSSIRIIDVESGAVIAKIIHQGGYDVDYSDENLLYMMIEKISLLK